MQETPKRKLRIWWLDVLKQGLGASYAHVLNMVIAAVLSGSSTASGYAHSLQDQCAWYGMGYLLDTTLGLFLAIVLLKALDIVANQQNWTTLKHSGVYGEGIRQWTHQVLAWMAILSIVKIVLYGVMTWASRPLAWIGSILFRPLQAIHVHLELVFVMIVLPGILNVIYFWIADSYLKAHKDQADAHEESSEGKKQILLTQQQQRQDSQQDTKPAYTPPTWTSLQQRQTPVVMSHNDTTTPNNNNNNNNNNGDALAQA